MKRAPLRRKTRLRPISPKKAAEKAIYDRVVKPRYLAEHPECEVGAAIKAAGYEVKCRGVATTIHHRKGRIGKLLNDTRWFMSSCTGECHPQWVHQTHVAEARELGMLL